MEVATKAHLGPDHQFMPFNVLGINVYDCSSKAGYSFHTDGNIMHYSIPDDPYPLHLIPTSKNLTVWTSTFMKENVVGKPLKITWVDDPKQQHVVASVDISNDTTTIQGVGVNHEGRKHGLDFNVNSQELLPSGNVSRVVITARNLIIPSVSEKGYDVHLSYDNFPSDSSIISCDPKWMVCNLIAYIENLGQDVYFTDDEDRIDITKQKKPSSKQRSSNGEEFDEYSDCWMQCNEEDYELCGLSKPQPYLTTKESTAVMYA